MTPFDIIWCGSRYKGTCKAEDTYGTIYWEIYKDVPHTRVEFVSTYRHSYWGLILSIFNNRSDESEKNA